MRRRRLLTAVAILALAGVAAAASIATTWSEQPGALEKLSSAGRTVDLDTARPSERATLAQSGVSEIKVLDERGGVRLYRGEHRSGKQCYVTGVARDRSAHFGILACPDDFPTKAQPILDYSPQNQGLHDLYPRLVRLAGFAGDGVAAVGVRDLDGRIAWTLVRNNVYAAATRDEPVTAIVARAHTGEIVYELEFSGRTPAEQYSSP